MDPDPANHCADVQKSSPRSHYLRWVLPAVVLVLSFAFWLSGADLSERFRTGMQAARQRDWKTARACADALRDVEEYHAHYCLIKGFELRARGKTKEALVSFSDAHTHPDTREIAVHEGASILYSVGEYSQVILMCEQVLQWNPKRTDTLRLLAAAYYDIGAMIQAINTLKVVIEQVPDDHRPHYMQASILHDFERFGDAVLAYEQAAARISKPSPARDEILAGWGACLVRLRRHEEALEVLKPASDWADVQTQRAVALLELRKPGEALTAAESALRQQPLHHEAATVAARCYELSGDAEKGIALLQAAVDVHPFELELHLRLADMLSANGQPELGLEHRKKAAQISEYRRDFSHKQQDLVHNDNDASLRFEIGQLAEKLGKIEIARGWLRAAVGMSTVTDEIQTYWLQFQQRYPSGQSAPFSAGQVQ